MARQRLAVLLAAAATHAQPSGLLISFKRVPALSVPLAPQFTWIVPNSPTVADAAQTAYRIVVAAAFGGNATIWDSGRVASNASVGVPFGGAALRGGRAFTACVSTWLSDGAPPTTSPPALFTTALDASGWAPGAAFLWAGNGSAGTFALLRRELRLSDFGGGGAPLALALLHASATPGDDTVLTGYTTFVAGALVGVGPGRGEARVWGGDGVFRGLPYDTHDVTAALRAAGVEGGAPFVLAAAGVGAAARGVLLQLDVFFADGSVASVATDGNFSAFDADAWLGPTDPARPLQTAYHPKLEFTDARLEPVGWRDVGFAGAWPRAAVTLAVNSTVAAAALVEKIVGAVVVVPAASTAPARIVEINSTYGFVDFTREFQGGLVLSCAAGAAGARVTLTSGERHNNGTVLSTWGYSFTWVLRKGPQVIEQLQYMEFRYVSISINASGAAAPLALADLSLSAWRVAAPWDESESAFSSTNATLDAVWAQSRYTLSAGDADTCAFNAHDRCARPLRPQLRPQRP
jgi:alpha-L-rhamnosidase